MSQQLLTNFDFSEGTTGWTASGGFGSYSYTSSNQIAILDGVAYFTYVSRTLSQIVDVSSSIQNTDFFSAVVNLRHRQKSDDGTYTQIDTYNFEIIFKDSLGNIIATKRTPSTGEANAPQNFTDVELNLVRSEIPDVFNSISTVEVKLTGLDVGYWNGNHGPMVNYIRLDATDLPNITIQTDQSGANDSINSIENKILNFSIQNDSFFDYGNFSIKKGSGVTNGVTASLYSQNNGNGEIIASVFVDESSITQSFSSIIFNLNTLVNSGNYSLVLTSLTETSAFFIKSGNTKITNNSSLTVETYDDFGNLVSSEPLPTSTSTPLPTSTPNPTSTSTPNPTSTSTPNPTSTSTPNPTSTSTPTPTSSSVVPNSRILFYDFNDINSWDGGVSVVDLENNSNGTFHLNGPEFSDCYRAIEFNGLNNYVVSNVDLNPYLSPANTSSVISIFTWFYPTGDGVIVSEQGSNIPDSLWFDSQIQIISGSVYFGVWPYVSIIQSSVDTPLGQWHYLGLTYDGTTLRAYVNGQLAGSSVYARQTPFNDGKALHYALAYGTATNLSGSGKPYGKGRMGTFEVYNTSLSQNQIISLYNNSFSQWICSTPTPTLTGTPTPTSTPTSTPNTTASPTPTSTPSATALPTPTPTNSSTPEPKSKITKNKYTRKKRNVGHFSITRGFKFRLWPDFFRHIRQR